MTMRLRKPRYGCRRAVMRHQVVAPIWLSLGLAGCAGPPPTCADTAMEHAHRIVVGILTLGLSEVLLDCPPTDHGTAPTRDYAKEAEITRQKALAGDVQAQYQLGIDYHYGLGVPSDFAAAVKWYSSAANQGLPEAQGSLGQMYEHGWGVAQDNVKADMWYSLAAKSNLALGAADRDLLEEKMTADQIAEARKLASEWKPANSAAATSPDSPTTAGQATP